MFRVSPTLRAAAKGRTKQNDNVQYSAAVNTRTFINLRKMAPRWEFIKPIYENLRRGDFAYVRYYTDYEFCQRFEGIVTQIRRSHHASSFVLTNPQSGISQRIFFFAPTLLFAEIKKPTSEDLMWFWGKENEGKRKKVAPTSPPLKPQVPPKWYKPEEAIIINSSQEQKSTPSTQAVQQQ